VSRSEDIVSSRKRSAGAEFQRLADVRDGQMPWRKWGPYLSERGWTGIVARAMHLFATTPAEQVLALGKLAAVAESREVAT
jgi:hypothetical protein